MLHQLMREISHSNVKFISADLLERVTCINMMHKFMKNISRSNLIFVATPVLNCATRANMLNLFMKKVNYSNMKILTTSVSFAFSFRNSLKPHKCNNFLKLGWQQWWLWVSRLSISQEKDSTAPKGFGVPAQLELKDWTSLSSMRRRNIPLIYNKTQTIIQPLIKPSSPIPVLAVQYVLLKLLPHTIRYNNRSQTNGSHIFDPVNCKTWTQVWLNSWLGSTYRRNPFKIGFLRLALLKNRRSTIGGIRLGG